LQIGVFTSGEESGTPLHLQMHRIRSGKQTTTVTGHASRPRRH
jgi:hypothetical protein